MNFETNKMESFRYEHPMGHKYWVKDAHELSWKKHIDVQAAFQEYTDLGVSKTINVPSSFTIENIVEVYKYAHRKGLKGVTVYRDMSKENQPIQKCEGEVCVL